MEHGSLGVVAADSTASQLSSSKAACLRVLRHLSTNMGDFCSLQTCRVAVTASGGGVWGPDPAAGRSRWGKWWWWYAVHSSGDQPVDLGADHIYHHSFLLVVFPSLNSHSLGTCTPLSGEH